MAALCALCALLHAASAEPAVRGLRPDLAWARGLLGAGLKSDDICQNKTAACAGDCSHERVLCQLIPTLDVWINTQNETCPKGQYCSVRARNRAEDSCSDAG